MGLRISRKQRVAGVVFAGIGAGTLGSGLASATGDPAFTVSVSTTSSDFDLGPYDLIVSCADGAVFVDSLDVGQSSTFTRPAGQPMDCELSVDETLEQQVVLRMRVGDSLAPSDGRIATPDPERIPGRYRRLDLRVDAEFVPVSIQTIAPYLDDSDGPFRVELNCADGFSVTEDMAPTDSTTVLLPGGTELDCGAEVVLNDAQADRFSVTYSDGLGASSGRLAPGQLAAVAYNQWGSSLAIQIAISEPSTE